MLKNRFAAIAAMIGLIFATLVNVSAPASAAGSSTDATLSSLGIASGANYQDTGLRPGFSATQTWYQYATTRNTNTFTATANDAGATIHYKWLGQDVVVASGVSKDITLADQITNVVIEVVAADGVTKQDYTVQMQVRLIPQPQLVSISPNVGSIIGGDRLVIKVKDAEVGGGRDYGTYCYTELRLTETDGNEVYTNNFGSTTAPDSNGVSTFYSQVYGWNGHWLKGPLSLKIRSYCGNAWDESINWWRNLNSEGVFKNVYSVVTPTISSIDLTDANTNPTGRFIAYGKNINGNSDIEGMAWDPAKPDSFMYVWDWGFTDNNSVPLYFDYVYDKDWNYVTTNWTTPGKKSIILLACGVYGGDPHDCWDPNYYRNIYKPIDDLKKQGNLLYQGTVNYSPLKPTNITVSPTKGPLAGGNQIKISGHRLRDEEGCDLNDSCTPVIKIGDQVADVVSTNWGNRWNTDSIDQIVVNVPAGTSAGSYPITINSVWGATPAPAKYTYGAKPVITSITPTTVSNSGGSLVTLVGTGFGKIGTPSVTIDGIKSPCVTRVSDTKVVAMVPADTNTGSVDLNMIVGTGGGSLDTPSQITLAAEGKKPSITKVAPSSVSIGGGDSVTLTGADFGAAGTVGVMVGANCANVTASTSTSVTFDVPSGDAAGAADITVASSTGTLVKVGGLTYVATPGVTSVTPSSLPTTATGADAKVVIVGIGFGKGGTIQVGSAKAVAYTATDTGTKISGIAIPTTTVGNVQVVITPTGAKVPFTTSVKVTGPTITYIGPDPVDPIYKWAQGYENNDGAAVPNGSSAGGTVIRIDGTGFGATAGQVLFGTVAGTVVSWSATSVIVKNPALTAGYYDITVKPATGTATALRTSGFAAQAVAVGAPVVTSIASVVDNGRAGQPNSFDPGADLRDDFVLNGANLTGTDNGATTKLTFSDGGTSVDVTPYAVTATSLKFHAPRNFNPVQWITLTVTTNVSYTFQDRALYYVGQSAPAVSFGPDYGLCTKTAIGSWNPAVIGISNGNFGSSGTVTLDGTTIAAAAVTWTSGSVSVDMSKQSSELANPWGTKTIVFTPSDSTLPALNYTFTCGVDTSITTKINGSTAPVTIAAGTSYTASAAFTAVIPTLNYTPAADGYEWVTASDYGNYGFSRNVTHGLPVAAGDYYVRVVIGSGTYAADHYARISYDNDSVHLTITGTPVSFTPKLNAGGATLVYKGQLGDGTNGTSNDIGYTATATSDPITKVYWQYKNHSCADNNQVGWNTGLPSNVAIAPQNCGGDGVTVSSWDIRVSGFDMLTTTTNKNIYYLPTYNVFNLTITKKQLTVTAVKSTKVYDGSTNLALGQMTVTGAVGDENPTLDGRNLTATFADANAGANKAVTLSGPLVLANQFVNNYELTNPNYTFTGTILKADATLKLTPATPSLIMGNTTTDEITVTVKDTKTGQAPIADAQVSAPVLVSTTTGVCTISGTTVTAVKAGDCVITATQAASTNYNASKAFSDNTLTTETLTIKIFAAPKQVQVVADDVTAATGDSVDLTASATGLIEGDSLGNVSFDVYQGTTLLNAFPTTPGTYKIVPRDASLNAADSAAYQPTLKYVSGKLVITAVPPVITTIDPANGPEAGGNVITITGTGLGQVTSIVVGTVSIRKPNFVVNGDGTQITFKAPKGSGQVDLVVKAGSAQVINSYSYDAPAVVPELSLKLQLALDVGAKLSGQKVTISGGGLKAGSDYTLVMHSTAVTIYTGTADADGNFTQEVTIPDSACVDSGEHNLQLTGIAPSGKAVSDTGYFHLANNCVVGSGQAVKTVVKGKVTWTLSGFLFKYRDDVLTKDGISSLTNLLKIIKGAKTITIYGYTETDTKDEKIKKANLILAKARCVSVSKWLQAHGLSKATYKLIGKGGVDPVSLTDQSKNRRVVVEATF